MESAKEVDNGKLDPLARILGGRKPEKAPATEEKAPSAEASNGAAANAEDAVMNGAGGENPLEAIRKAVFGDRIDALSEQLRRLESDVREQNDQTKKHVADGFSAFEKFVKRELKTTVDRMNEEAAERMRQIDATKEKLEKQVREAEERMTKMEKEMKRVETAAADELSRRADALTRQIEDTGRRVYERVRHELDDVESSAANRFALGDVLKEMGDRLAKEKAKAKVVEA